MHLQHSYSGTVRQDSYRTRLQSHLLLYGRLEAPHGDAKRCLLRCSGLVLLLLQCKTSFFLPIDQFVVRYLVSSQHLAHARA